MCFFFTEEQTGDSWWRDNSFLLLNTLELVGHRQQRGGEGAVPALQPGPCSESRSWVVPQRQGLSSKLGQQHGGAAALPGVLPKETPASTLQSSNTGQTQLETGRLGCPGNVGISIIGKWCKKGKETELTINRHMTTWPPGLTGYTLTFRQSNLHTL